MKQTQQTKMISGGWVAVIRAGAHCPSINQLNTLQWPCASYKQLAGFNSWGDWRPRDGMIGKVIYQWPFAEGNRLLLQIGDKLVVFKNEGVSMPFCSACPLLNCTTPELALQFAKILLDINDVVQLTVSSFTREDWYRIDNNPYITKAQYDKVLYNMKMSTEVVRLFDTIFVKLQHFIPDKGLCVNIHETITALSCLTTSIYDKSVLIELFLQNASWEDDNYSGREIQPYTRLHLHKLYYGQYQVMFLINPSTYEHTTPGKLASQTVTEILDSRKTINWTEFCEKVLY